MIFKAIKILDIEDLIKRQAFDLWLAGSSAPSPDEAYEHDYARFSNQYKSAVARGELEKIESAIESKSSGDIWLVLGK